MDNSPKNTGEKDYTQNIFQELSWELDIGKKKAGLEETPPKWKEYYLKLTNQVLSGIMMILILFIALAYGYVYIQKDPELSSSQLIDPLCFLILWDLAWENDVPYCSSIAALKVNYEQKTTTIIWDIARKLDVLFFDLYSLENFSASPEYIFLANSKINRLKVIDILNDFDKLKNSFTEAGDRKRVQCEGISITSDNLLTTSCFVYSSGTWEQDSKIVTWWRDDIVQTAPEWTSMTFAAEFLEYIQKNPEFNFQLLDKQKSFTLETTTEWLFTHRTKVDLRLKYNNFWNNLSY